MVSSTTLVVLLECNWPTNMKRKGVSLEVSV